MTRAALAAGMLALRLVGAACSRSSSPAPLSSPPVSTAPASAAPLTAAAPDTPATPVAPVASAPVEAGDVALAERDRVAQLFAGFADKSDFTFLRAACAPRLARFIALRDVDVEAAIRTSRAFFKDTWGLKYQPDLRALRVEAAPGGTLARVPVRMQWSRKADPEQFGLAADTLIMGSPPSIDRDVTTDVELTFDPAGRLTSYVEAHVRTPLLRATAATVAGDGCDPDPPKGTIVQDLGESIVLEQISTGPAHTLEKVRLAGQDVWMTSQRHFWLTSSSDTVWLTCLEPVGDAGR